MLKPLSPAPADCTEMQIGSAQFPTPFASGLEYNPPARGPWNIVHTGMLLPQAHQIFVCAQGCLRGVILTAAEMNAMDRMSWVSLCEEDIIGGNMEQLMIDGVANILQKLHPLPPAVLLFISCIQQFVGCDFPLVLRTLRSRFPDVDFADCYMNPTMRKSGLTPDQLMRRQLYSLLRPAARDLKNVNLIGNDRPTDASSELLQILRQSGFRVRDITQCKTYDEYQQMAESAWNITYLPTAAAAGDALQQRLGQKHLYLPLCYRREDLLQNYKVLADTLGLSLPDFSNIMQKTEDALDKVRREIGNMPVTIDYTAVPRPLSLVRMLLEHGFCVSAVYADSFSDEEGTDFHWLQQHAPTLRICATIHPSLRFCQPRTNAEILAIGQKAAYFSGTAHFVNIVSGGGMYGFDGIARLAEQMLDAYHHKKDTRTVIQKKGLGCACCL